MEGAAKCSAANRHVPRSRQSNCRVTLLCSSVKPGSCAIATPADGGHTCVRVLEKQHQALFPCCIKPDASVHSERRWWWWGGPCSAPELTLSCFPQPGLAGTASGSASERCGMLQLGSPAAPRALPAERRATLNENGIAGESERGRRLQLHPSVALPRSCQRPRATKRRTVTAAVPAPIAVPTRPPARASRILHAWRTPHRPVPVATAAPRAHAIALHRLDGGKRKASS